MFISIIIPIYNVAPYVEQCLRSVINQTITKYVECIIVDDCGQDNSMAIVENFLANNHFGVREDGTLTSNQSYLTFSIIHHTHSRGLSAARNTGIEEAKGKYIYFLDGDDWIVPKCMELMIGSIKKYPASQIVFAGATTTFGKYEWLDYTKKKLPEYSNHQTEGIYHTDFEWTYLPLSRIETFIFFPKVIYLYFLGRIGQTMAPDIYKKNLSMRINGLFPIIDSYESCQREGCKRNGINVNMDFQHTKCTSRVLCIYKNMFARQDEPEYVALYKQTEQQILHEYPDFYNELDSIVYPTETFILPHICFRLIRSWRKYGKNNYHYTVVVY